MATGTGKTRVFSYIATQVEGRVLVLVHRDELAAQARDALAAATGELIGLEKAQERHRHERIVVASTQSMSARRMIALKDEWGEPDVVIVDELHRYGRKAKSFWRAATFFTSARFLGVTATPKRKDRSELPIDEVCYTFSLPQAIDEGWLVPLRGVSVHLQTIDLSLVRKTKGDMMEHELDMAMLKAVEGIVAETLRLFPDRKGPVFFPGVESARRACDRFNDLKPGSAVLVTGATNKDERRDIMRAVKAGEVQFLCNCQVATEGFDWPGASIVVMGRPTSSTGLFAQMVGRGTRPLADLFGWFEELEDAEVRRSLIAQSEKKDCVILDFYGNAGKHDLVSLVDLFAEDEPEEVLRSARELHRAGDDPKDAVKKAKAAVAEFEIKSKVVSIVDEFDFFGQTGVNREASAEFRLKFGFTPATTSQKRVLERFGVTVDDNISKADAGRAISLLRVRRDRGLANVRQCIMLGKLGWTNRNIYASTAEKLLNYAARKQWKVTRADLEEHIRSLRRPSAA